MAGSVNLCIIVGNLGQDPDVVVAQNGNKVVKLSIATSERWRDKATGEQKEVTDWHRITIFDKTSAEFAEKYLKKGNKVYVEGKQKTRKWEKDGVTHYSTEVVVAAFGGRIDNLTRKRGIGRRCAEEDDYGTQSQPHGSAGSTKLTTDPTEDIPF